MSKLLLVVDMQNDFVDGALGTKEAQAIVPAVCEKIKLFDGTVLFTRDTHGQDYLRSAEGKHLPIAHCIEGTQGWQLCSAVGQLCTTEPVNKKTFGSKELAEALLAQHQKQPIEEITLVGLCTDICVISNALLFKTFLPETSIVVDAACCAGVTPQSHETALQAMRACQIKII